MDEEKALLKSLKPYLMHIACALILVLGFGLAFPAIFIKYFQFKQLDKLALEKLYYLSGWFYSVTAFATFFVVLIAAILAYSQLSEISKSRKLTVIFELSRYYASEEMHKALITVWTYSPEIIEQDWEKLNHRRMVSDFWGTVGWGVKEGLIELNLVYTRFGKSAIDVWDQRLRELEVRLRTQIEQRNPENAGMSDEEIKRLVEYHVDNEGTQSWLSRERKKRALLDP
jgi:hypothetical protein